MKNLKNQKIVKDFGVVETKVDSQQPRTLVVKISSPAIDRSHDTVQPAGMNADNFMKNPVVLFAHKYDEMPIAKCTGLKTTDNGILATVQFPDEGVYDKADTVYKMYKSGFLNAWSIGFMPTDYDQNADGGLDFKSWELFEFSSVPVPDNPEALTVMRSKGINVDVLFEKGVLPFHETPKAPEDQAWDAGEQVKNATVDDLKEMCAWVESDNADNKGAYKLPHHEQAGEHAVVWNGVRAAMGALLGARGGVDIPDGDRKGVYNHLAKHYAQFEKEVPDFKSIDDFTRKELSDYFDGETSEEPEVKIIDLTVTQFKELLVPQEKDINEVIALSYVLDELSFFISAFQQNGVSEDQIAKLQQALELVMQIVQFEAQLGKKSITIKVGRTISSKHEKMLKDAHEHMKGAMENIKTVIESVASQGEEENTNDADKQLSNSFVKKLQQELKIQDKSIGLTLRLLKQVEGSKGGE